MEITKMFIADLRGGFPEKCSFCGRKVDPSQIEPEEAGDWACHRCLLRWAEEDGDVRAAAFWKRCIKESDSGATRAD